MENIPLRPVRRESKHTSPDPDRPCFLCCGQHNHDADQSQCPLSDGAEDMFVWPSRNDDAVHNHLTYVTQIRVIIAQISLSARQFYEHWRFRDGTDHRAPSKGTVLCGILIPLFASAYLLLYGYIALLTFPTSGRMDAKIPAHPWTFSHNDESQGSRALVCNT